MEQQEARQPKYTIETLPAKTLLHYIKKDQIEKLIPPSALVGLRRRAAEEGAKVTAKYLKAAVLSEPQFIENVRASDVGREAFQKYAQNFARITAPEVRAKSLEVRAQMAQPRKGFLGCVATKVDPKVYRECAQSYDRPEYQSISLVPSGALKKSVYAKTGNPALSARPGTHISDLPRGLKAYIRANPIQYMDYLDELRAQAEYLKSLGRSAREEQRQQESTFGPSGNKKKRVVVGEGRVFDEEDDDDDDDEEEY